ncbi:hypothetical protein SLA2020_003270 [Shorea laevis]
MGRGVSSGGGQSSLGYLFGSGESPKPSTDGGERQQPPPKPTPTTTSPPAAEVPKQTPAVVPASNANNYFRADGQNCGNFLTDRPTTKVHAAPGGSSSLDYLFGSGEK